MCAARSLAGRKWTHRKSTSLAQLEHPAVGIQRPRSFALVMLQHLSPLYLKTLDITLPLPPSGRADELIE